MEFIEANYMWIMIVIIVFTITLIGYIADKSNLIRPNKKKKDNKNKEDLFDKINSESLSTTKLLDNPNIILMYIIYYIIHFFIYHF